MNRDESLGRRDGWTAAHCVAFRELFAVCGRAGTSRGDARSVVLLTSLSGRFAWHAELLFDLLPVRADVDRAMLLDEAATTVAPLRSALDDVAADVGALCGVLAEIVVPRLLRDVEGVMARTDARLDGPRVRALTLVARDLRDAEGALAPTVVRTNAIRTTVSEPVERAVDTLANCSPPGRGT